MFLSNHRIVPPSVVDGGSKLNWAQSSSSLVYGRKFMIVVCTIKKAFRTNNWLLSCFFHFYWKSLVSPCQFRQTFLTTQSAAEMGTPVRWVVVFSHPVCVKHYFIDIIVDSAPICSCFSHKCLFNFVHTSLLVVVGQLGKEVSRQENFAPNHRTFVGNFGLHRPI